MFFKHLLISQCGNAWNQMKRFLPGLTYRYVCEATFMDWPISQAGWDIVVQRSQSVIEYSYVAICWWVNSKSLLNHAAEQPDLSSPKGKDEDGSEFQCRSCLWQSNDVLIELLIA